MRDYAAAIEALAKQLGVTVEGLRASEFWRDIGGQELDALERAMREESDGLGEAPA